MLLVSWGGSRARTSGLGTMAWGPAALWCSSQQAGWMGLGLLLHGCGVGSRGPGRWCKCQVLAPGSIFRVPECGACLRPLTRVPQSSVSLPPRWSPLQTCYPIPHQKHLILEPRDPGSLSPGVLVSGGGHRVPRSSPRGVPPLPLAHGEAGVAVETSSLPRGCLCPGRPLTACLGSPELSVEGCWCPGEGRTALGSQ